MGMRRFARWILLLISALCIINGCAFFQYQPQEDSEYRVHPLRMKIYNMSGSVIPEQEWQDIFRIVHFAKRTLEKCAAPLDVDAVEELLRRSIIIIPPKDIFILMENVGGFIDLRSIFIRRDQFFDSVIRHEWLHLYLFINGDSWLADWMHMDPRFIECKYVFLDVP